MSYRNQEDWVHIDDHVDALNRIEELERMLKAADVDEAWLEQQNKELRQELDYAKSEIKYLESKLAEVVA
jgi:enterochelin esterase-like enzyme